MATQETESIGKRGMDAQERMRCGERMDAKVCNHHHAVAQPLLRLLLRSH
jgi:hypothetical protein